MKLVTDNVLCVHQTLFALVLASFLLLHPFSSADTINSLWTGGGDGLNWSDDANWSPAVVPNNAADTYDVTINSTTVNVDGYFQVDTINTDSLALILIDASQRLDLINAISTSTHNGIINLANQNPNDVAYLGILGTVTIEGSGRIQFGSSNLNQIVDVGAGQLTIGGNQRVETTNSGNSAGQILVATINNGTIAADTGEIKILSPVINNNLLTAINAGTLILNGIIATNDESTEGNPDTVIGKITIDEESVLKVVNSSIIGGAIDGGGEIEISGHSFFKGSDMTINEITTTIGANDRLDLIGNIDSTGHIIKLENDKDTGEIALLVIYETVNLTGTGAIQFATSNQNQISYTGLIGNYKLNLGVDQIIETTGSGSKGEIYVPILNDGLISADNGEILIQTIGVINTLTNNSEVKAVNGGVLNLNSASIVNNEGANPDPDSAIGKITIDATSVLNLTNARIIGGTIEGGGNINVGGNSVLDGAGMTINNITTTITENERLDLIGNFTSANHIIKLANDKDTGEIALLVIYETVNLTGTGAIQFTTGNRNIISYDGPIGNFKLNLGVDQVIETTGSGSKGEIYVPILNDGLISADNGEILIQTIGVINTLTNNSEVKAVNGGVLNLNSASIVNNEGANPDPDSAIGKITIDATSVLNLTNARIIGGTIEGGGNINVGGNSVLDGAGMTINNITTTITENERLDLIGSFTSANHIIKLANDKDTGEIALLMIYETVNLTGTGAIQFTTGNQNIISYDGPIGNFKLNLGADHVIQTTGVGSKGEIYVPIFNDGRLSADNGRIMIATSGINNTITNNNILEAVNGGTLAIVNTVVENADGNINITGSALKLDGTTINNSGGALNFAGTSTFEFTNSRINGGLIDAATNVNVDINGTSTFDGEGLVINNLTSIIGANDRLDLIGDINSTNHIIKLANNGVSGEIAQLVIIDTVNLTGTGAIQFTTENRNLISYTGPSGFYELNLGAGQVIRTTGVGSKGEIYVPSLINDGLISANDGLIRVISPAAITNNATMEAISNGSLSLESVSIYNDTSDEIITDITTGTITIDDTSTLHVFNSTIVGGTLNGGGNINIDGSSHFDGSGMNIANLTTTIGANDSLRLTGNFTQENHIIRLADQNEEGDVADLGILGGVLLAGSGSGGNEIQFTTPNQNRVINYGSGKLTIDDNQRILTTGLRSSGLIYVNLENNGYVSADGGAIELSSHTAINNNVIEAINNGTLKINSHVVINDESNGDDIVDTVFGSIHIDNSSQLNLTYGTIIGGAIHGGGNVHVDGSSHYDGTQGMDILNITTRIGANVALVLHGDISQENHLIKLADQNGAGDVADLGISGTVSLSGINTGGNEIQFTTPNQNRIIDHGSGVLAIDAHQTITTTGNGSSGLIYVNLENNGVVSADAGDIEFSSYPVTNNNLIQAINAGTLEMNSSTVNNQNGSILIAPGSLLSLNSAAITGGNVTNNGHLNMFNSTISGGTFTDNSPESIDVSGTNHLGGTVTFNGSNVTVMPFSSLTLDEGGEFINNGSVHGEFLSAVYVNDDVTGTGNWSTNGGSLNFALESNVSTSGNLFIDNGGQLNAAGTLLTGQDLLLTSGAGGESSLYVNEKLSLSGSLVFDSQNEGTWNWNVGSTLEFTGGVDAVIGDWENWSSLEIGGFDFGDQEIGYANGNFYLPTLMIGSRSHLYLENLLDNGNLAGSGGYFEALYVDNLIFSDALGLLNLNNLNLYYHNLTGNAGQIINVFVNQAIPEPSTYVLFALVLFAIAGYRRFHNYRRSTSSNEGIC